MQTAERFDSFGQSVFAEITALANKHGAVNLGQGFPNFDGPDFVKLAAIEAMQRGDNQYAPSSGIPVLREAIAARFARDRGITVDADTDITVTSGCTEALAAAFLGIINPGDEVILFEPYYDSYRACVAMAGGIPRFVTLRPPHYGIDGDELAAAFTDRTRAILINTPHNPSGKVFDRAELELIADLCHRHNTIAITDEVYEYLVFEGEHISLASLDGMYDRTLTLSSLGKTFSLTGWKIGWAIGPPPLTNAIRAAHQYMTFSIATPLQFGATAALKADDAYFARFLGSYRARRDLLIDGLARVGFEVSAPAGTYFVLAGIRPFGFDNDVTFCRHLIEHIGVAAIPPSSFYHNPADGRQLLRFAFCKDEDTLRHAIRQLSALTT